MDTTENKTEQYTKKPTAEEIVKRLADWSKKYPKEMVHSMSNRVPMDNELYVIEDLAKNFDPSPMEVKGAEKLFYFIERIKDNLWITDIPKAGYTNDPTIAKRWDKHEEALEYLQATGLDFNHTVTEHIFFPPMEVKDAEAIEIDFGNHVRARIERLNGEYKVTGAMNGYGDAIPESEIKIKPTEPTLKSQLQSPVISAHDFLKEKGISNKVVGQTNQYKEVRIIDLLTEYLQRQGQKTNQNKL